MSSGISAIPSVPHSLESEPIIQANALSSKRLFKNRRIARWMRQISTMGDTKLSTPSHGQILRCKKSIPPQTAFWLESCIRLVVNET